MVEDTDSERYIEASIQEMEHLQAISKLSNFEI